MSRKTVSAIMLFLLVIGTLTLAFKIQSVKADGGTIYINADGSITPSTAPISTVDNITYTFTGDIRYPVYLGIVVGRNDSVIDGNGHVVRGDSMFDNNYGVTLEKLNNVTIKNTNVQNFHWGIGLFTCTNCTVSGNNATENLEGIGTGTSSYNVFVGNNMVANGFVGMEVGDYSNNNIVIGNNAEQNGFQTLPGKPPEGGIFVDTYSDGNIVVQNNMTSNFDGMYLGGASNTSIYHNNFLNNIVQMYSGMYGSGSATVWANGYPSGGNYWSDYAGVDFKSGPSQNQPGSDGIGDTPCLIDSNNTDQYPLIKPWASPVHNINTGLNYPTIQQAIDAPETLSGHTIIVGPGNYTENLNVYKTLKILGAGEELTRIIPLELNDTVHLTASNLTLEGFTIQSVSGYSAVRLDRAADCNISNNTIIGSGGGITLGGSSDNTVSGNVIVSLRGNGIWITDSSQRNKIVGNSLDSNHYGIVLFNGSNYNVIADNFVNSSDWVGIRLNWLESNLPPVEFNNITGNIVCNNYEGIMLDYPSNHNPVDDNFVLDNYIGINLRQANNTTISGNTITNNHDGIDLESSSSNSISGNNITANKGDGIMLYSSADNSVSGNNIANNDWGIVLDFCSSNTIYHNNFINNNIQDSSYDSTNVWDNGYPSGGNYWSDYNGTDLHSGPYQNQTGSDGIGDTPYLIYANYGFPNEDHYPLMNPLGWHDVAVTSVVAAVPHGATNAGNSVWVFQGLPVHVNVTVLNKGYFDENVTVTLYYNITANQIIGAQNVTLSPGQNETVAFVWDTTSAPYCQNYTLTAVATIPLDNNLTDNTLSLGPITVRILGDINGDGKVDGKDIALVGLSFGSCGPDFLYPASPPYPRWNLDCDINCDNKIDGKDLTLTALHFGQADP